MDTPKDDADAPDTTTLNWANKSGYKPGQVLKKRVPRRPNLFAELGQIQKPKPVVGADLLKIDVSKPQGIVMHKALKGSSDKKTCIVEFGGNTLVLKGGSGDAEEHVAATQLIGKLGLKGVSVPQVRMLDDQEKAALVNHFQQQGDFNAKQLATSMTLPNPPFGRTSGQLSELVSGVTPQKLYPSTAEQKLADDALARREDLVAKKLARDAAWDATCQELIARCQGSLCKPGVIERAKATSPADRAAAMEWMRENCGKDSQLMMVDILDEIENDQLPKGVKKLKDEATSNKTKRAALEQFAATPEGVEAFAGVAAVDLVTGMDDRIMTKFNGGNFLFDPDKKELVCVDNAKNIEFSLNAPSLDKWKGFINGPLEKRGSLEDVIYQRLYGTGPGSGASQAQSAPGNYVKFNAQQEAAARKTIRETLLKVIATVEGDPTQSDSARDRAAFLKARMEVEALFRFTAQLPNPPTRPDKLSKTEKLSRAGKSFFTANKKDKRNDTQRIKDQLRSGKITAAQASQQLQAVEAQNPGVANDRRSEKIRYLAAVMGYCEILKANAKVLNDIAAKQPGLLAPASVELLSKPLCDSVLAWQTALADDKKTLAVFNAAWNEFPDSIKIEEDDGA